MMMGWGTTITVWAFVVAVGLFTTVTIVASLEQKCLSGKFQKPKPGVELNIGNSSCAAYSKNSCCNETVATNITRMSEDPNFKWLSLRWNHCKNLSTECQKFFVQDICFYECSPNLGPWLVEDKRKHRRERFKDVPLCRRQCDDWYEACKDDQTCASDWSTMFSYTNGENVCKTDQPCRKFSEVFNNSAKAFCEQIFGGSFQYVYDNQPCYSFNFSAAEVDLNDKIEQWRSQQLSGASVPVVVWNWALSLLVAQWCLTKLMMRS